MIQNVETWKPRVFQFCGSRGSESRLAKVAGAELSGGMRDQKLHLARGTFPSRNGKIRQLRRAYEVDMFKKGTPTVVGRDTLK